MYQHAEYRFTLLKCCITGITGKVCQFSEKELNIFFWQKHAAIMLFTRVVKNFFVLNNVTMYCSTSRISMRTLISMLFYLKGGSLQFPPSIC